MRDRTHIVAGESNGRLTLIDRLGVIPAGTEAGESTILNNLSQLTAERLAAAINAVPDDRTLSEAELPLFRLVEWYEVTPNSILQITLHCSYEPTRTTATSYRQYELIGRLFIPLSCGQAIAQVANRVSRPNFNLAFHIPEPENITAVESGHYQMSIQREMAELDLNELVLTVNRIRMILRSTLDDAAKISRSLQTDIEEQAGFIGAVQATDPTLQINKIIQHVTGEL